MDSEGRRAKEMIKGLPFKERMKHFWYYYSKHVLVGTLGTVLVAWSVVQCVNKPTYDLDIAYYSSRAVDQTAVDAFAESLDPLLKDIDGNEAIDVFIPLYVGNIEAEMMDQQSQALMQKFPLELAADDYALYILDKPFMDFFERVYPETVDNKILLSEIPETAEMLKCYEGEELYLVTIAESERVKKDEKKMAERENAYAVEAYFEKLIEQNQTEE